MDEKGDEAVDMDDDAPKQEGQDKGQDMTDGQTGAPAQEAEQHGSVSYVDNTAEIRKASEPKVEYGSKISEPKAEYSAKKTEKPDRASTKPFHDKLEAKKGEVAKQLPPKPAEVKDKHTSL